MFIELEQFDGWGLVGFDADRVECVRDNGALGASKSCAVFLRSGASFSLPGRYKEVVARIHKKNVEA